LAILRLADDIMIQEITAAGVYREIGQAFVVLLPVKSVGVMGDCRTYEQVQYSRGNSHTDLKTSVLPQHC
jgi:GMP synthase (glutamine-hydrolysing)